MRIIFVLVLIAGVGLAAFAVSVAMDRFDQYQTAIAQQRDAIVPTTDVFVVTRQVRYGEPIRPGDVRPFAGRPSMCPSARSRASKTCSRPERTSCAPCCA
jgi:Flp pilus assembly protein CpaB